MCMHLFNSNKQSSAMPSAVDKKTFTCANCNFRQGFYATGAVTGMAAGMKNLLEHFPKGLRRGPQLNLD